MAQRVQKAIDPEKRQKKLFFLWIAIGIPLICVILFFAAKGAYVTFSGQGSQTQQLAEGSQPVATQALSKESDPHKPPAETTGTPAAPTMPTVPKSDLESKPKPPDTPAEPDIKSPPPPSPAGSQSDQE
jgi:hypothetical protein